MVCTFFGHRIVYNKIRPILKETIIDLIEKYDVNLFYVGNHGGFDSMVRNTLEELALEYNIKYYVVLAYLPKSTDDSNSYNYDNTIIPEGFERVPKRFAIPYRNKWMIGQSDYVITFVTNNIDSGAAQFKRYAEKQGKTVINLPVE